MFPLIKDVRTGFARPRRSIKMVETSEKYFECPVCGYPISFRFDYDINQYVAMCPYCEGRLLMDKEEYEADDDEIYFEKDF